jgi:tetratricopeptide (TPR) repeat protein
MRENQKDDYSQLLPIFIYPNEQESQSLQPDMEKVIDKCSEVIERHSIYKRKKEYIKWIDDSYFLIGKARFYKREFGLAENTFLYVYQAYKQDPDRYKGLNWLIKTFIETKQFDKAEEFIDLAEDEKKKYPEEHLGHFNAIYADFFLKKDNDTEAAIEKLEEAVRLTKEKELKRRYLFILGQLYQQKRDYALALDRYSRVLRLRPDYVMRFNAKINRATSYDVASNNSEDIKKELRKMLKDSKNIEFKDQIYYALAEISIKEDDEPKAIEHLKNSTRYSVNNNKQKGLSYLKLADIYFERPDYINAQAHYDSTLQYLPDDHPEYYTAEDKNNNLQELVKNLKIIEKQDSLLALSNLSEKEQRKKVKEMIKALQDEEEKRKLEELRKLEALQESSPAFVNTTGRGGKKGEWYFYNPTTMALGSSDFTASWGGRPLEDDWRRKNKNTRTIVQNKDPEENEGENDNADEEKDDKEKYDPDFYLKEIPKDVQGQLIAHGRIAQALMNVGTIFKESFSDYNSAIGSFTRITSEYDTSRHNLPAHYQLYRIYLQTGQAEKADEEKKWVLDNHPFSEYAYLIKNPLYNKESKETKEKIEEFYAATYKLFKYGLYKDVIESCEKADKTFAQNHIKAKFDFLKAKAIGYTASKEDFKKALEKIVAEHGEDPVKDKAQQILDYMKSMNAATEKTVAEAPAPEYAHDPKEKHLLILSSENNNQSFKELRNQLSNFNQQYFKQQGLDITSSILDKKNLYLVKTFNNQEEAIRYLKALRNNTAIMSLVQQSNTLDYLISTSNFRMLLKSKDEKAYLDFFLKKYEV